MTRANKPLFSNYASNSARKRASSRLSARRWEIERHSSAKININEINATTNDTRVGVGNLPPSVPVICCSRMFCNGTAGLSRLSTVVVAGGVTWSIKTGVDSGGALGVCSVAGSVAKVRLGAECYPVQPVVAAQQQYYRVLIP